MSTNQGGSCQHQWKYVFGMGRWYRCVGCQVIGDFYYQRTALDRFRLEDTFGQNKYGKEIVPRFCTVVGCSQPAVRLCFHLKGAVRCAAHQHEAGYPPTTPGTIVAQNHHPVAVSSDTAENRQVNVFGTMNTELLHTVRLDVDRLVRSNRHRPITLVIDSPGGETAVLLSLGTLIHGAPFPIDGLARGQVNSAAFWLLQECRLRLAHRDSLFSFHAPYWPGADISSVTCFGPTPDFVEEKLPFYQALIETLVRRSGQPRELLEAWGRHRQERHFTASEAKQYGLIDSIMDL